MKEMILDYMKPGFRYKTSIIYNQFKYSGYYEHEIIRELFGLASKGLLLLNSGYWIKPYKSIKVSINTYLNMVIDDMVIPG